MSAPRVVAGRYQVGEVLGEGAWGIVRQARDMQTGERVAIKVLKSEVILGTPNAVERFKREADALSRLNHPNIVGVLTAVVEKNLHAIVMEYVGGGSLGDKMADQPQMPVQAVLQIALELMSALVSLQQVGIIHRDLKPGNILFASDGTVRLSDFGLVFITGMEHITATGVPMGTTNYLSPEAVRGEKVDGRADIWASGIMIFEMLTGRLPFSGRNFAHTLNAIMQDPLPDLAEWRTDIPPGLVRLVERMLVKDRDIRMADASEVRAALEAVLQESGF
jgi:serine/threonine protein kinase